VLIPSRRYWVVRSANPSTWDSWKLLAFLILSNVLNPASTTRWVKSSPIFSMSKPPINFAKDTSFTENRLSFSYSLIRNVIFQTHLIILLFLKVELISIRNILMNPSILVTINFNNL
jgi:hypothetical protein